MRAVEAGDLEVQGQPWLNRFCLQKINLKKLISPNFFQHLLFFIVAILVSIKQCILMAVLHFPGGQWCRAPYHVLTEDVFTEVFSVSLSILASVICHFTAGS